MMADANVGKPKDAWKPPKSYKSALAKTRDAQKAKEGKDKKNVHAMTHDEDTASDSDGDLSEAGYSIHALRPLPRIIRKPTLAPMNAMNRFQGLDEAQEYDPDMLQSLNSWHRP